MVRVDVSNLQKKFRISSTRIESLAIRSCQKLKLNLPELSIVFVGSFRMRNINKKFLGHDYVTDVITFEHGEIIICPKQARQNALHHGTSLAHEIDLYVVHGLLHLAGYDDHAPKDIRRMRMMETALLHQRLL